LVEVFLEYVDGLCVKPDGLHVVVWFALLRVRKAVKGLLKGSSVPRFAQAFKCGLAEPVLHPIVFAIIPRIHHLVGLQFLVSSSLDRRAEAFLKTAFIFYLMQEGSGANGNANL